jgi:Na+/proline symporter
MVIVSYQFNAMGKVLETILTDESGTPIFSAKTATVISAVFITAYTVLAGLLSVAYTDVGNGILMTVTLVIVFPVLWMQAGGWSGMEASFAAMGKSDHMRIWGIYPKLTLVNFLLPTFLLVMGDANMYQRFSASRDAKAARKATILLVFGVLLIETLIVLEAWISSSLIPDAANGRHVLIYAANRLMTPFLGAIMMTTIVGIIVSTADSFLLVPANCLMRDVYLNYINPKASERKIVFLSRMLVLALGIVACVVSLRFGEKESFFKRALYAYTIYGTAITPSLVAALFWKGATTRGAISSIVSGTVVTLLWKGVADAHTDRGLQTIFTGVDAVLPAIGVSILCLVVVSLLTQKTNR